MTSVLSLENPARAADVAAAARAIAGLFDCDVRHRPLGGPDEAGAVSVYADVARPEVVAVAVAAEPGDGLCWQLATGSGKPVLVVPVGAVGIRRGISRVLVPLDGTDETADAVAPALSVFVSRGADVLLLHVFGSATVPAFWDHPEHADPVWRAEFAARYAVPEARVQWRSGLPSDSVSRVAASEEVDLVVLAWSQRLDGHAETVRRTVDDATVPVLLLPVAG